MSWFVLALIAPLLWAVVALIDDHLLRNVYRSATFATVISGVFGFLPAVYIALFHPPAALSSPLIAAALAAGLLTVLYYFFYFRTLDSDEPSIAVALNNMAPALVAVLAFFFLAERLSALQYLGVMILICSSFALAVQDVKKFKFASSIWFAMCGALAYSLASIFAKYAYEQASFTDVYFWISIGFGLAGLNAFAFLKKEERTQARQLLKKGKIMAILIGAEFLNIAAELVQGAAINGGPVTVVRALEGLQPLYMLAIAIILAGFFPNHFRERKDSRFYIKIIFMAFMVVGLFML
jgi:drug/metabolite transporter (DMT)-like permease